MACKWEYKGKDFTSEEDLERFITSEEQQEQFAERWNLTKIKRGAMWGYVPKGGIATRKLATAIQDRLRKVGEIYNHITPVFDATHGMILFKDSDGNFLSSPGELVSSEASPATLRKVNTFLDRIGVEVKTVKEIVVNGQKMDANAVANTLSDIIQVVEGKESGALTEEAMHFAVDILEQKNPILFNQMMNKIASYQLYNQVYQSYSKNPLYQKDGRPDIRKIKKEAIGKILAEYVIKNEQGSTEKPELIAQSQTWWQSIIDFLKGLFNQAGFNPFEDYAKVVLDEEGGVEIEGDTYLQAGPQKDLFDRLQETHAKVSKVQRTDPNAVTDDEEASNWYEVDGKQVKRRITDKVKRWYESRFGKMSNDKYKDVYEIYRNSGIAAHADMEDIFGRYVDDQGLLRRNQAGQLSPLPQINTSKVEPSNNNIYKTLELYFADLMETFPAGTRFRAETIVYNPNADEAGTIDFLYILPDGKVGILDWKFMSIKDGATDVPWFKQEGFNIQLGGYKQMLRDVYGVTEFHQARAIPFLLNYTYGRDKKLKLTNITTGTTDKSKMQDMRLAPVATHDELTGIPEVDKLIEKLRAVHKRISDTQVKEGRKDQKMEQLNSLFQTIRQLQIRQNLEPLAAQAVTLMKSIDRTVDRYNTQFKGKEFNDVTEDQINEYSEELLNALDYVGVYTNVDIELRELLKDTTDPILVDIANNLKSAADSSRIHTINLTEIRDQFAEKFIANRFRVKDLLKPERVVQFFSRQFKTLSQAETSASRVLWNMVNRTTQQLQIDTDVFNKRLIELEKRYDKWSEDKGMTARQKFDMLFRKDKDGKREHALIDQISRDFYKQADEAREKNNIQFFKDNIDLVAYKKEADEYRKRREKDIDDNTYSISTTEDNNRKKLEKQKLEDSLSITDKDAGGWGHWIMRKHVIKDKWYTPEFRELLKPENAPALEFYNLIQEVNEKAKKVGYLQAKGARNFIPYLRKSWVEAISLGGSTAPVKQLIADLTISESEVGYGQHDPLTGQVVNTIPKYFIQPIEQDQTSTELFKLMSLYNEQVDRYSYHSDLEAQANILMNVERSKKSLQTNNAGNLIKKNGEAQITNNNEQNAKLLENYVKASLFGQQFNANDTIDQTFGKWSNETGKKLNGKIGFKLFPEDLDERRFSAVKLMDTTNRFFQLKTLGLNLGTSITTFLGGQFQALVNAGRFFNSSEFFAAEMQLAQAKFQGEEEKTFKLLDYFVPFSDLQQREQVQSMGSTVLTRNSFSDVIMTLQRNADKFVQYTSALAYIRNMIVINGQVVNAREYYRNSPEFKNRYNLPQEERRKLDKGFDSKIKELIETNGVFKVAQIVDGEIVIPGIERKSDSVLYNRSIMQQIGKNATGNVSSDDMNQIRMNVLGRSFMVFKNWIPRLAISRFGGLSRVEGTDSYEWGRTRMLYKLILDGGMKSMGNLHAMLAGTDKGVTLMRELYEKKKADYRDSTGKELEMSPEEFMDMVRQNIKSQYKDALFYLTLLGIFLAAKAIPPDDEEDEEVKGAYKYTLRMIDKIHGELAFFYNPISFQQILNGSLFPSLGIFSDFYRVATNSAQELGGLAFQNEEWVESAKPAKYIMKTFPISKEMVNYLAIFFPDTAKEMGIQLSTQSRIR